MICGKTAKFPILKVIHKYTLLHISIQVGKKSEMEEEVAVW